MSQTNDILKSALIGVAIGGIAGLLLAPKKGTEFRDELAEGYQSLRDGYDSITEKGNQLKDKLKKYSSRFNGEEDESTASSLWIGGAIGAVIGVTAALFLAQQSGEELREQLGDKYDEIREKAEDVMADFNSKRIQLIDKIEDWKDTFTTLVNQFSKEAAKRRGGHSQSKVDEIADWARIGLQLYEQFQGRR